MLTTRLSLRHLPMGVSRRRDAFGRRTQGPRAGEGGLNLFHDIV
jgi:hypothetical protein